MKFQGKLISKDNQILIINVESFDIWEAEKKILKIFENRYLEYHSYGYELSHINTIEYK